MECGWVGRYSWLTCCTHHVKRKKIGGERGVGKYKKRFNLIDEILKYFFDKWRTCQLFYEILKICRERYKVMNEFTLRNININITVLLISGAFLIYLWPLFLSTAWACYLRPMRGRDEIY